MKIINLKVEEAMAEQIERFAKDNNLTKSSAARLLLARALGNDLEVAYIAEVVNRIQTVVRGNVGQLLARWQKELVTMLSATLETTTEEITAEVPSATELEREAVRARAPGQKPGGPAKPLAPARPAQPVEDVEVLEPIEGDGLVELEQDEEAEAAPEGADLLREAEETYWGNYREMLAEIGADAPTEEVANEAARLVARYQPAAIEAGWKAPVWGSEDFAARKARAFPQGGVRGRR